ncbi:MAG: O-antigen ligase family protein [Candidatus Paceibacterota bacterium]
MHAIRFSRDRNTNRKSVSEGETRLETTPYLRWADRLIDGSLVAILFLAPLVLGGRHPAGRLVLMVAALPGTLGLVLKVLAGHNVPLGSWQLLLLAACFLLPLSQVTPVSPKLVDAASPGLQKLFGEAPPLVAPSLPNCFSLSPATTAKSLPLTITYLCIFTFVVSRLDDYRDAERLMKMLVGAGVMLAAIALLQANFGNGKFVWFYDHPTRDPGVVPRGPFQNENHLSSILATILPCALYFLFRPSRDEQGAGRRCWERGNTAATSVAKADWQRIFAMVACILTVCTVYATPSRGGAAIIAVSGAAWLAVLGWDWLGKRWKTKIGYAHWKWTGVASALACASIGLVWLSSNLATLSYWRSKLWKADFQIWHDFPLLGVGAGNHRFVYRAYLDEYFFQTFSTAESSWIQLLVETGGVGVGLAAVIVTAVLLTLLRVFSVDLHGRRLLMACALLAGLLASCAHAVVDFPWQVPACFVTVLAIAALAIRIPRILATESAAENDAETHDSLFTVPSSIAILATGLLLAGNVWAIHRAVPHSRASQSWDAYRRLVRDKPHLPGLEDQRAAEQLLRSTLEHDPLHVLARARWISWQATILDRERFLLDDPDAMARRIFAQCKLISRICPTESRSYLYASTALAGLNAPLDQQQQFLYQSQRLRPVDGQVALKLGLNALMQQDEQLAHKQFALALEVDPSFREPGIQALTMIYQPSDLVERWSPGRDTAAVLYRITALRDDQSQREAVGQYLCARLLEDATAEKPTMADHLLKAAYEVASEIESRDLQLQISNRRLERDPRNVSLLLTRARLHEQMGTRDLAQTDVQRSLQLAPHDPRARRLAWEIDRRASRKSR